MSGAVWALIVLGIVRAIRRHRRVDRLRAGQVPAAAVGGPRRWHRCFSFALVTGIGLMWLLGPSLLAAPGTSAGALPFVGDCKSAPSLESPGNTSTDFFDSDSEVARGDGTAYGKYGWAGLTYQTYDLGCGPDVVRAPTAVADTTFGNAGLAVAKWVTGFAVWMDRQTAINPNGTSPSDTVMGHLDKVVANGSKALRTAFYDPWIGVAVTIVAVLVLVFALKAAASSAMRQSVIAGAALFLAALVIGAPLATTHEVNRELNSAVGHVQDNALRQVGVDPKTGPREAIINQIIIRQWLAGYYDNADGPLAKKYGPKLRDSLAWTWSQRELIDTTNAELAHKNLIDQIRDPGLNQLTTLGDKKHSEYTDTAAAAKHAGGYLKFIGKDGGRTSAGWTAALEAVLVNMLWIAASMLRFVGTMIVQLAVLFGPVWAPAAMVSERVLTTVVKFVGAALFWAVVASAAVAVDLVAMTGIFTTDLSAGWKVFVMVLISAVIWMLLRPFKRLTQFATMRVNPRQAAHRGANFAAALLAGRRRRDRRDRRERRRSDEPDPDLERPQQRERKQSPQEGVPTRTGEPMTVLRTNTPAGGRPPATAGGGVTGVPARPQLTVTPGAPGVVVRSGHPDKLPVRYFAPEPRATTPSPPPSDSPGAAHFSARVLSVDPAGRVVEVHDDVYDPTTRFAAPARVNDGQVIYDVYDPRAESGLVGAAAGAGRG